MKTELLAKTFRVGCVEALGGEPHGSTIPVLAERLRDRRLSAAGLTRSKAHAMLGQPLFDRLDDRRPVEWRKACYRRAHVLHRLL